MADIVDRATRSRMMSGIRAKNTQPEVRIRKALFAEGFRYRLHAPGLPGKPDIVLSRYQAVILVHGCFWHGHNCNLFRLPSSNREFWLAKINRNREVDRKAVAGLRLLGWRVLTIWECSFRGKSQLGFRSVIETTIQWLNSASTEFEIRSSQ